MIRYRHQCDSSPSRHFSCSIAKPNLAGQRERERFVHSEKWMHQLVHVSFPCDTEGGLSVNSKTKTFKLCVLTLNS